MEKIEIENKQFSSRNRRKQGAVYEKKAQEYLTEKGYQILECNFRNRSGEIDIIAKDGEYLCFIEVKYRTSNTFGNPLEAVDFRKQNQIRRTAQYYLMKHRLNDRMPCRFDVIAFEGEVVTHLENAF